MHFTSILPLSVSLLSITPLLANAHPQLGRRQQPGVKIYNCAVTGTIALTFDDGPYSYTSDLLNILGEYGAKATFFVTGTNIGKPTLATGAWDSVIKRMDNEGHQVASHTWSHKNLESLDEDSRRKEMNQLADQLSRILGKTPTYMRPPYSACESSCLSTMASMGYRVIYFNLDTDDYNQVSSIQVSKNKVASETSGKYPGSSSILSIAHDIHSPTVYELTRYMLETLVKEKGFRPVTVGTCLGDSPANWYS